jgi:hypothetical protein
VEVISHSAGGFASSVETIGNYSFTIVNSYTRATIVSSTNTSGSSLGGFIYLFFFNNYFPIVNITNCYSSGFVFGQFNLASSISSFSSSNGTFIASNFYFNNQTNPQLPALGSGNSTYLNIVNGIDCSNLLSIIMSFDQSIWVIFFLFYLTISFYFYLFVNFVIL